MVILQPVVPHTALALMSGHGTVCSSVSDISILCVASMRVFLLTAHGQGRGSWSGTITRPNALPWIAMQRFLVRKRLETRNRVHFCFWPLESFWMMVIFNLLCHIPLWLWCRDTEPCVLLSRTSASCVWLPCVCFYWRRMGKDYVFVLTPHAATWIGWKKMRFCCFGRLVELFSVCGAVSVRKS